MDSAVNEPAVLTITLKTYREVARAGNEQADLTVSLKTYREVARAGNEQADLTIPLKLTLTLSANEGNPLCI